ncbi:MAG: hypothetical protein OEM24_00170 [Paracoccaceae bacterium]|nr:hypothetical protein [Paracoccaceae bacterium]
MADTPERPPTWKAVVAAILDFLFVFLAGGYVVGALTGGLTDEGFSLQGLPALLLLALIIGYFWLLNRYAGGTIFRHLLGIPKPRP